MKTIFMLLLLSVTLNAQTKETLVKQITDIAEAEGVCPDIAVAIAKVESGLNPNAVGGLGEIGLFQLRPEYHNVIPGKTKHNTRIAVEFMKKLQDKYGEKYGNSWFVLYNYGPGNPPKRPTETKYYKKVIQEVNKIRVSRYLASN